jgi:WD40 repeat protein
VAKKQYSGPTTLLFDMASVVAFSPDSRVLAVGLHNGQIQLWNLDVSRTPLAIMIPFHARLDMNTLAFSPDGKLLASGSWDKKIILWAAGQ